MGRIHYLIATFGNSSINEKNIVRQTGFSLLEHLVIHGIAYLKRKVQQDFQNKMLVGHLQRDGREGTLDCKSYKYPKFYKLRVL